MNRAIRTLLAGMALALSLGQASPPALTAPAPAVRPVAPSPGYPLEVCVVSGEPLDRFGDRRAIRYKGYEIQVCCAHCQAAFQADPQKFLEKYLALTDLEG